MDNDARVPERQRLEHAFIRARWLGAAGLALLGPLGGLRPLATVPLLAALAAGNLALLRLNRRAATLTVQRRIGVAAVALDSLVVLAAAALVNEGTALYAYAALIIVAAEASVRYAPPKGVGAAIALAGGLAIVMAVRGATLDDRFVPRELLFWGGLLVLAGAVMGLGVREAYRVGVAVASRAPTAPPREPTSTPEAPSARPAAGEVAVTDEMLGLLTPRERQVLTLIAQGYSNPRIAAALLIEPKTVKNHINNIYGKLQVHSRYEVIARSLASRREATPKEDARAENRM
ncbi:MAG: response regulator transcription factor [SAR202 cluster bacterium]|nr:response regulator transcription factor [SAR202 cluster bacterium]